MAVLPSRLKSVVWGDDLACPYRIHSRRHSEPCIYCLRIADQQLGRAQDKAVETANQAEEAIRQNPLSAVAIAVGLGFLFGVFTRR